DRGQEKGAAIAGRTSRPTLSLWREESANPFAVSGGVERLLIAEGVLGLELQFYADGAWTETWDASDTRRLPELVEVALTFEGGGGREETYRTVIALPPMES
ncbi:MAG: type II secretion system protein GspJ, partial [Nitrospirota bacterium]